MGVGIDQLGLKQGHLGNLVGSQMGFWFLVWAWTEVVVQVVLVLGPQLLARVFISRFVLVWASRTGRAEMPFL